MDYFDLFHAAVIQFLFIYLFGLYHFLLFLRHYLALRFSLFCMQYYSYLFWIAKVQIS